MPNFTLSALYADALLHHPYLVGLVSISVLEVISVALWSCVGRLR